MAGTTVRTTTTGMAGSDVDQLRLEHNRLVDDVGRSAYLTGSATYDPASLADGVGATTTLTVTGAVLGDFVIVSFSLDLQGIGLTGYVSAADTVSVRFQNESTATVDLASGTLRALVLSLATIPTAAAQTAAKVADLQGNTTT